MPSEAHEHSETTPAAGAPIETASAAIEAPTEHRLHPLSILFGILRQLRQMLFPIIALYFAAKESLEQWLVVLLVPFAAWHVVRYFTLRYRLEAQDFVLRGGLVFKFERHVPFARIQSIDVEQGPIHRLFGVHEISLQTGGGSEPEARLRVVSTAALQSLREVWRLSRAGGGAPVGAAVAQDAARLTSPDVAESDAPHTVPAARADADTVATPERSTVLALSGRELALAGLIEGRTMVVFAAILGALWEFEALGVNVKSWLEDALGTDLTAGSAIREIANATFAEGSVPIANVAFAVVSFVAFLVLLRLLSMLWYAMRLWGFRLVRERGELRTEFGLLTRVNATIPLARVQSVTILESPLQRLVGRVAVRVETAGGAVDPDNDESSRKTGREWIAPILPRAAVVSVLTELLPEIQLETVQWRRLHPRGALRASRAAFVITLLATGWLTYFLSPWVLLAILPFATWNAIAAWKRTLRITFGLSNGAVVQQRGWLWRSTTAARLSKVQVAALHESPFDRRHRMARVSVDTAGNAPAHHRIDVPYLRLEDALELRRVLAEHSARTTFRWS